MKKILLVFLLIGLVTFLLSGCVEKGLKEAPTEEALREKLADEAEAVISKDPCEATLDDVRGAFELAGEAQKLPGMDATADQLIDWAAAAFKGYAARRVAAGAGAKERTELAAEAQKIPRPGMDQLAEDLMTGEPIESPCVEAEAWEGTLELTKESYSYPYDTSRIYRVEFTFNVDKQGTVQGRGHARFTLLECTLYPWGRPPEKGAIPCPCEHVVPDFDMEVSGQKWDNRFALIWNGTVQETFNHPECTSPDGFTSPGGSSTSEWPLVVMRGVPAQQGTHSCDTGCIIKLRNVTQ